MGKFKTNPHTGKPDIAGLSEEEILALGFIQEELDPVFAAWLIATPPLYSETDPLFSAWLSATPPLYNLNGALLATGATTGATSQSQVFTNGITLNATTITTDTTTGLKVGNTNQKIAVLGATPIVRSLATTDLGTVLSGFGFRTAGTAYPITTSGTVTLSGTFKHSGSTASFFNAAGVSQQGATIDPHVVLSNMGFCVAGTAWTLTTSGAISLTGTVGLGVTTITNTSTAALKVTGTNGDALTVDTTNMKVIIGGSVHEWGITGDESMIVLTTDLVTINDTVNLATLNASKLVFTDASKNLTSTGIGTSAQFIKGDGSLDSTAYEPAITAGTSAQFLKGDKSLDSSDYGSLASPVDKSAGTVYQAAVDGFIYIYITSVSNTQYGALTVDASNPPTTQVAGFYSASGASYNAMTLTPIKKDQYYKLTTTGSPTVAKYQFWGKQ